MPTPTRSDSFEVKPQARAATPEPIVLATIATATSATVNAARAPSSRPLACSPMLMKNTGTKSE